MPRTGRQPQAGLEPRDCAVCGARFQPYRANGETCSKSCYRKLPRIKDAVRTYRAQDHIRERKNSRRRVTVNPDRREVNLRSNLRQYGITLEKYREMLAGQDGRCAICGDTPAPGGIKSASRLHVDHDHVTNRVRALLCSRCNQGIGYFKDDPALFHAAAQYIERHRASPEP